ncbi:MAG: tRNA (5-methylaminomethyl-2-thiouridine)(34)-methyltransferase MnmD [Micavibrio sp.]|nr:tRNA (5-methylaminomethyl-2-thiouridine)(34)-methyltransferase MnmD [Micavibrio sp.]
MAAPRSKQFDDVYFSAENGFAETEYVFIRGNGLPEAWAEQNFTIFETGFGTGLNFLCAWRLWNETNAERKLHFISVEKFPLSRGEIESALEIWRENFEEEMAALLAKYPENLSGTHRIAVGENSMLTLIFDDVNEAMPKLNETVDCWCLDGFKPKKNPEMWTDIVFQNMARMSKPGTTFATFTAAGFVRRGLQAAGFDVKRIKGYGTKWHMLTGVMT